MPLASWTSASRLDLLAIEVGPSTTCGYAAFGESVPSALVIPRT